MTPTIRVVLFLAVFALPSGALAASCPTNVLYEPTGVGSVDAGWTGNQHDLALLGPTLNLTVACGPASPPCGTCAITGVTPLYPAAPPRCVNDTSIHCAVATEVAQCGAPASCRTYLGPPQSLVAGFFTSICITTDVAGPVGGTVDIESGAFAPTIPVRTNVFFGSGERRGCPRCIGDPIANDGIRAGTCDAGPRHDMECDANATSVFTDFGSTSFDCPPASALQFAGFDLRSIATSTGTLARTLGPASPRCPASGGIPCFCGQCDNIDAQPCFTNADCPASGGNPGICGGTRCIGGANSGAPCATSSECPAGVCNRIGEPPRPNACLEDTLTGDDCVESIGGEGECVAGPVDQHCSNHPNRRCVTDAECDDVLGACIASNRRCFADNGVDGAEISVTGTATPPAGGIADPVDLAVLGCLPATGSASYNYGNGLPGLLRGTYPGRLVIIDPASTPVPTPTSLPTPIPQACSAAPALCRQPVVAGKSLVHLVDDPDDRRDRFQWKWNRGSATSLADFGDPVASDPYSLCLYENATLRAAMHVPPGGTCDGKPCWRASSSTLQYRDKDGVADGITQLVLRAGSDGRASIQAKGRGVLLPMPPVGGFTGSVRVQLRNRTTGLCWEAAFPPPFQKHTSELLKDKDG